MCSLFFCGSVFSGALNGFWEPEGNTYNALVVHFGGHLNVGIQD